jgi:hypothetical protein
MSNQHKSNFNWRTGPEIDERIDKMMFDVLAKTYEWDVKLSIKPRRCFWSEEIIWPFTYCFVSGPAPIISLNGKDLDPDYIRRKKTHIPRWISKKSFTYLTLKGIIRG